MTIVQKIPLFLLLLGVLFAGHARAAAPTCAIDSITNLNFGVVDPNGGSVDQTATLSYHCTYSGFLSGGAATLCFNLGRGNGGTSWVPRTMKNALETMDFQIYQDAARVQIWSGTGGPPSAKTATMQFAPVFWGSVTQNGTLTLYGRVPSGQTSLAALAYTSLFTGGDASMTYKSVEGFFGEPDPPATCTGSGTDSASFTANASVASKCQIDTATDMSFGSAPSNFSSNLDQSSTITMTCTRGTAWNVGLDNGQNAIGTTRRMKLGANYVNYELYRNTGRSLRWGNTIGADTLAGSGTGVGQAVPVYGRVPVQAPVPAGNYADKITVTVTY